MSKLKVLVACEFSEIVKEQFLIRGHDAHSCDFLPGEKGLPNHHQCDVREILNDGWDLMIAHPPCTYLANVGIKHINLPGRMEKVLEAREFFLQLLNAPIDKICIENPMPHKYAKLPRHSTKVSPRFFGGMGDKITYLWLKNLPPLMSTYIYPMGKRYKAPNGRQGSEWFYKSNSKQRSITNVYLAVAMAEQWSSLSIVCNEVRNE